MKLNPNGTIAWQKIYGGNDMDYAESILQTSDGGYVVAGGTMSFDVSRARFHSWVLKLNAHGEIPHCSALGTGEVFVSDTSVTAKDTHAIPENAFAQPFDTNVIPQNTETEASLLCRSSSQPE